MSNNIADRHRQNARRKKENYTFSLMEIFSEKENVSRSRNQKKYKKKQNGDEKADPDRNFSFINR